MRSESSSSKAPARHASSSSKGAPRRASRPLTTRLVSTTALTSVLLLLLPRVAFLADGLHFGRHIGQDVLRVCIRVLLAQLVNQLPGALFCLLHSVILLWTNQNG